MLVSNFMISFVKLGIYHITQPKILTLATLKDTMNKTRLKTEAPKRAKISPELFCGSLKRNSSDIIEKNFTKFLRKF